MNVARPALLALLVGVAVLASPALVLQFQEPTECANDVEPASDAAGVPASAPEFQYDELSRPAKRAFDRARSARDSVTVTGDECPAEFEYGVDRSRYVVVQDESRYVLTTGSGSRSPGVAS